MNIRRCLLSPTNKVFHHICSVSRYSKQKIKIDKLTQINNASKLKLKSRNKPNDILFKNELLHGRHVCNIALNISRRPIFKLHLLKSFENSKIQDNKVQEMIDIALSRKIAINYLSRNGLDDLTKGELHQGVCLEVGPYVTKNFSESDINSCPPSKPLWILLTGIMDPMNVGAILRSCFYFDIDRVLIDRNCAPISPVVSKASCGAVEILDLFCINNIDKMIEAFQMSKWDVIGTVSRDPTLSGDLGPIEDLSKVRLNKPSLIIFGNEAQGIPDHVVKSCTRLLTIKCQTACDSDVDKSALKNMIGSLNVSNAAAVTLYELHKRKLKSSD